MKGAKVRWTMLKSKTQGYVLMQVPVTDFNFQSNSKWYFCLLFSSSRTFNYQILYCHISTFINLKPIHKKFWNPTTKFIKCTCFCKCVHNMESLVPHCVPDNAFPLRWKRNRFHADALMSAPYWITVRTVFVSLFIPLRKRRDWKEMRV